MTFRPAVTVVVPCRNQAEYLRAALHSVATQTYSPTETIVVDDESTDDTTAVAVEAGARVFRQTHAGVGAARNRGLREARGAYVIFLDADDELMPDAVESGVSVLEQFPNAWMAARCCVLIDSSGSPVPTNCPAPATTDLYKEWLHRNLVWTPGAAMFRRAPLAALGGFPVQAGPAADYAVYLELARSNRVVFQDRVAVRYRQHDRNMSLDPARMLRATLAVLRREEPHVPPRYRRHFKAGIRDWCTFYGEQIIQQLRSDLRVGRLGSEQFERVRLLLRECRSLAFTHATRKLRRVLAGHAPSEVEPGRFSPFSSGDEGHLHSVEPPG